MDNKNLLENGAEIVTLFCRLYINTKKDLPIRSSHMGLLILSVKHDSPVTPIEAAKFFKVKKPMVTAMVNSLEKEGYLTKQPSAIDRRSYLLIPTQKGIQLVEETYCEYFSIMEALYRGMGEADFQKMLLLMEQANVILEKERE